MAAPVSALRAGDLVRIRDAHWRVDRRTVYDDTTLVEVTGCDDDNRARHAAFLAPFDTIGLVHSPSTPRMVGRRHWRRVARRTVGHATSAWTSLRAATRADLRIIPFQLEPALALTRGEACRFLIADAVGLGKTVQAGLMLAETLARRPDAHALVVAPAALREQWRDELDSRFSIDAVIVDATALARLAAQLPVDINPWSTRQVIITSIDYIKRPEVVRALETLTWDLVIFDEAHNLTGRSDRSVVAAALANRARALVLATATPHSGDDMPFERLCGFGDLGRTGPLLVFRRTRTDVGLPHARRDTLLRIRPTHAEWEMHAALMVYARLVWRRSSGPDGAGARLAMSVLARRACSSAASLARSLERRLALLGASAPVIERQSELPFDITLDDAEPGAVLGADGLGDLGEERASLRHLIDLARRAATAESKLSALRRLIVRANEPVVVFTDYRDTLDVLATTLTEFDTVQLHGGLSSRERVHVLHRFTAGAARVLLATDTASEGLNLHQRCRFVVTLELPWTPVRMEQRAGRVDRIGQTRTVHVVHLVARETCEETTLARLVGRITRIRDTLCVASPVHNERRIADVVLGDEPVPNVDTAPRTGPAGTATIDLRREALAEAERITKARTLLDESPLSSGDMRGVIAHLSRRRNRWGRQCIWTFTVTVASASGQVLWEPLVTLATNIEAPLRPVRHDTRQYLAHARPSLTAALQSAQGALLERLRHEIRRPTALMRLRELELMDELRHRHARLSAGLLQGSLFDRRRERVTAAQAALLEAALAASARRVAELQSFDTLDIEACRLAFAAVVP